MRKLSNYKVIWLILGIVIITASVLYTRSLSLKLSEKERQQVEQWAEAVRDINDPNSTGIKLASKILQENGAHIPIIETDEKDSILTTLNIDTQKIAHKPEYLDAQLLKIKNEHAPIVWTNPLDSTQRNYIYYGESKLIKQIRLFPIAQILIAGIFIIVLVYSLNVRSKSAQNLVWAGMAKETAHQLGTPITSLTGWLELLKQDDKNAAVYKEMQKDVDRLNLVSDRFGKIGSKPKLTLQNINNEVQQMVDYIKKRASTHVQFSVNANAPDIEANINAPLFNWVIENLLKNALDAIQQNGTINIDIQKKIGDIIITVTDNGKGIHKKERDKIFKPGFSTKQRGWGLGLALSKRIIEQYHKGNLILKQTEPGKGASFEITLHL